ncbi:MAG: prepilin-type N-terminal cleavage/methylation domain-containing protein [Kiritimatiellia bacterium]
MIRAPRNYNKGFSLVEVCLAIAVVGIGLLGVFSLFPAGLTMNKKNTDATMSAMFAEDVLNGFHAIIDSDPAYWEQTIGTWEEKTANNYLRLMSTAESIWDSPAPGDPLLDLTGSVATLIYVHGAYQGIALRYKIDFYEPEPGRVRQARLVVWNGEFGSSNEKDGYVFLTTFYNYRM